MIAKIDSLTSEIAALDQELQAPPDDEQTRDRGRSFSVTEMYNKEEERLQKEEKLMEKNDDLAKVKADLQKARKKKLDDIRAAKKKELDDRKAANKENQRVRQAQKDKAARIQQRIEEDRAHKQVVLNGINGLEGAKTFADISRTAGATKPEGLTVGQYILDTKTHKLGQLAEKRTGVKTANNSNYSQLKTAIEWRIKIKWLSYTKFAGGKAGDKLKNQYTGDKWKTEFVCISRDNVAELCHAGFINGCFQYAKLKSPEYEAVINEQHRLALEEYKRKHTCNNVTERGLACTAPLSTDRNRCVDSDVQKKAAGSKRRNAVHKFTKVRDDEKQQPTSPATQPREPGNDLPHVLSNFDDDMEKVVREGGRDVRNFLGGQHSNKTKPTPVKVEKTWTCTAKDCGRTDLTEEEKKSHKTKEGTQCSNQNKGPDNGYTVTRSRRRLAADVPCKDCNRLCNPSEQCQSQQCRQLRIALRRSQNTKSRSTIQDKSHWVCARCGKPHPIGQCPRGKRRRLASSSTIERLLREM